MQLIPHNCSSSWNDQHGLSVEAHQEFFPDRLNWHKVIGLHRYHVLLSAGWQKAPWSTAALALLLLNPTRMDLEMGEWISC